MKALKLSDNGLICAHVVEGLITADRRMWVTNRNPELCSLELDEPEHCRADFATSGRFVNSVWDSRID